MATILAISGSLRKSSYNTSLLNVAATLMPSGSKLDIRTLHGVPLYNADDEEKSGIPAKVTELKDALIAADGLLLATPEYNNSIPGVLKNAMDWMSRPPADIKKVFNNKPVAVIGATPSGFGTLASQNAWLPVLRHVGMKPWFGGRVLVSTANKVFDEEGKLTDDKIREQLQTFLAGYVASLG